MSLEDTFLVVGIGASAGGIEALQGFFQGVPDELDAAFVVATHLNPERESLLHEVLARFTSRPVSVAVHDSPVESGHVYVLPEGATLTTAQGRLVLTATVGRGEVKPVDLLLASLATDFAERSVGVVLSGGDGDGTLGVKAIKEHGGITMAQAPDGFGPRHPSMPDTAISTGFIDFALPAERMGARLLDMMHAADALERTGIASREAEQSRADLLGHIYKLLRGQLGHDFSGYKTKTFVRRVERRMQVHDMRSMDEYLALLRTDAQEVHALFRDLLISVTSFFRDAAAFDALAASVIPRLFEHKGADDVVRLWVPGCATGEEVYSIAIVVREYMDALSAPPKVQLFATDIDDSALSVARAARYPEALMTSVSAERRERFFTADGDAYVVAREVRDLCIFSPHSLIRDPPFSRIDLVSCRNLLIYFGADVQSQVIPIFHYALRPGGFLFLGSAENVSLFDDLFESLEKRHRIFRRRSDSTRNLRLPVGPARGAGGYAAVMSPRRTDVPGTGLRQLVDQQVLDRFAPAHVVANRDGDVVYYSSRTGKYLEPPAGAPTRHLMTMARKDIRLDLRTCFRACVESGRASSREGVMVELEDGRIQVLTLHVEALQGGDAADSLYIVLSVDQGVVQSRGDAIDHLGRGSADGSQVEHELRETRDRLQSMVEEYETSLEELKASNEELVSVNEELQSTNEELEASKEELQSVNEELHTVNGELHGKIDALDRANSDLINLFDSTNVATVFLDRGLVIRSYTPAVATVFNIRGSDRGRPITDLSTQLLIPTLPEDIDKVFRYHAPIERRTTSEDGRRHYLLRVAPYQASDAQVDGVVVTFLDITSLTRSEARQRMLIAELQHRTRNLLTIVESIVRRTVKGSQGLDELSVRLGALSRVQGLVGSQSGESIDLSDMLRLELEAHPVPAGKVSIEGPAVPLSYDVAQTLCMALHELTTNAVKYGALRNDGRGTLAVTWRLIGESEETLSLTWKESGVAIANREVGKGFGRELIEQALAFSLRARPSWQLEEDGVRYVLDMPMNNRGVHY
ncbi:MAG: CheR family methyltransferase [Luteibacter sp.]|uniref:CheR family methyltransferase n=1 Tax=Luteibacter sp. TaxID=1886636 RepID=UPI00280916F8|nr:CheR family methyltransferase [Luteibacter sp.]MDQ7997298.1 CheR family methyltransferase [Luteibacter sp.]MDQ8049359.1 CheR family methyltransferase [Luteibacter sp.]